MPSAPRCAQKIVKTRTPLQHTADLIQPLISLGRVIVMVSANTRCGFRSQRSVIRTTKPVCGPIRSIPAPASILAPRDQCIYAAASASAVRSLLLRIPITFRTFSLDLSARASVAAWPPSKSLAFFEADPPYLLVYVNSSMECSYCHIRFAELRSILTSKWTVSPGQDHPNPHQLAPSGCATYKSIRIHGLAGSIKSLKLGYGNSVDDLA